MGFEFVWNVCFVKMIGFEFRITVVNHINVKWTIVKKKKKKKEKRTKTGH